MSLSRRVNVFLERARQLQSNSPKPRSPLRAAEESRADHSKTKAKDDVISNLENMIEMFMKNRCDINKRAENNKEKEIKFIQGVKDSLHVEIKKSKFSGFAELEKQYKDKTLQIMTVIKQETMEIDKKLVELTEENSRLNNTLNTGNYDKGPLTGTVSIELALDLLSRNDLNKRDSRLEKLLKIENPVYGQSVSEQIKEIIGNDYGINSIIAREINERANQWNNRLKILEKEIKDRKMKYEKLDTQIKERNKQNRKIVFEHEEVFKTRENRSATFGNVPKETKPVSVSPEQILTNIYTEIISAIPSPDQWSLSEVPTFSPESIRSSNRLATFGNVPKETKPVSVSPEQILTSIYTEIISAIPSPDQRSLSVVPTFSPESILSSIYSEILTEL